MEQLEKTNVKNACDIKVSLENGWELAIDWVMLDHNGKFEDMQRDYAPIEAIEQLLTSVKNYVDAFGIPKLGTLFSTDYSLLEEVFEVYIPSEKRKEVHIYFKD